MASVPPKEELILIFSKPSFQFKPAVALPFIGGGAAMDALLDLLQNEPDPIPAKVDELNSPAGLSGISFRQNLVRTLGEMKDPRAVEPLVQTYKVYRAYEDLIVEALQQSGARVPEEYDQRQIEALSNRIRLRELIGLPAGARFANTISGSHMVKSIASNSFGAYALGLGMLVRAWTVEALEKIIGDGAHEFFVEAFRQEKMAYVRLVLGEALLRMKDPRGVEPVRRSLLEEIDSRVWVSERVAEKIDLLADLPGGRGRAALQEFYAKSKKARTKSNLRKYAGWRLGLNRKPNLDSNCFIATAAFGTAEAMEVARLRRFREERLRPYPLGRAAIALYEFLTPALADVIRPRPWLRGWVRVLILRPALLGLEFLPERQNGVESAENE